MNTKSPAPECTRYKSDGSKCRKRTRRQDGWCGQCLGSPTAASTVPALTANTLIPVTARKSLLGRKPTARQKAGADRYSTARAFTVDEDSFRIDPETGNAYFTMRKPVGRFRRPRVLHFVLDDQGDFLVSTRHPAAGPSLLDHPRVRELSTSRRLLRRSRSVAHLGARKSAQSLKRRGQARLFDFVYNDPRKKAGYKKKSRKNGALDRFRDLWYGGDTHRSNPYR